MPPVRSWHWKPVPPSNVEIVVFLCYPTIMGFEDFADGRNVMPIKIPDSLPARSVLENENIFVMTEYRAITQDIRPLRLLILNLMPTKISTENQLLRKLSNTPLQIEIDLLRTVSYEPKNTDMSHLESFYRSFDQVRHERYDGMIITGAPVENMEFEDVGYWRELMEIMDWSLRNVYCTLHICWGAMAGLYHHFGIAKHSLPNKLSGVFEHYATKPNSPLFRGFDDRFYAPHSRNSQILCEDIMNTPELELMAVSDVAGVFAAKTKNSRQFFITGHPEYDRNTLAQEYFRDCEKGLGAALPENYFPEGNPANRPQNTWQAHAQLLYTNWLNYYVYQTTPYVLTNLESLQAAPDTPPRFHEGNPH